MKQNWETWYPRVLLNGRCQAKINEAKIEIKQNWETCYNLVYDPRGQVPLNERCQAKINQAKIEIK